MFGDVWKWAGKTRTTNANIGVPWTQIAQTLFDLFEDLQYWDKHETMPLLEQAVNLHHRAVRIHPFENGNGRWARMLANIWLKRHGHPITDWPPETGGTGTESLIRAEYLAAIREADAGTYAHLIELHQRYTQPPENR
jgi:fido (protein-threonine AMPylation protein)